MPVPPTKPITWTVINGTAPQWGSVIKAFSCEYTYSDGDTERVAAPYPIAITSGNSESRKAQKIKCVVKCEVGIRIDDDKGTHLFAKTYLASDFQDKCPDLHTTRIGPRKQAIAAKFAELVGDENIPEYEIVVTIDGPTKVGNG